MSFDIDTATVRAARIHGSDAEIELEAAAYRAAAAGDVDLDAVTGIAVGAAVELGGVLDEMRSLVAEHGRGLEASLTSYEAGERHNARGFDALDR